MGTTTESSCWEQLDCTIPPTHLFLHVHVYILSCGVSLPVRTNLNLDYYRQQLCVHLLLVKCHVQCNRGTFDKDFPTKVYNNLSCFYLLISYLCTKPPCARKGQHLHKIIITIYNYCPQHFLVPCIQYTHHKHTYVCTMHTILYCYVQ